MINMVEQMRDDIDTIIRGMLKTDSQVDFSRILTQENMFDASLIRSFLFQAFEEEEFEEEMFILSDDFIRGVLSGLMLAVMVEKRNNERMGTRSHAEIVDLYDSGLAYLAEKTIR